MTGIKLVIFDLDGTLINAYPAIIDSFNYVMKKLRAPLQKALVIRRAVGWGDAFLLKPFVKKDGLKKALSIYRKHHQKALLKESSLFPHVLRLLGYLKQKRYKIAVASNRPTKFSLILIRHLKLRKYFDYILCADKLKQGKPNPEILNKIRKKFSLKTDQVVYAGDMVIDAQAGRRAGIKTVIVTTGSSSLAQIKKETPQFIIKKISDLVLLL